MKFFDFFAGIGGFRLGMEMAGHECVGHCEIDKHAHKSYIAMHHPKESEVFFTDVRTIDPADMPECEVYCFGFPCQSFSIAGNRGGFSDTRGTLFFEVMRIARERKPRILLAENVNGLLSHDNGDTFETIICTMDELGYDVEWEVLNSKNYGVPQNRERVFIIGHLRGSGGGAVLPLGRYSSEAPELLCTTLTSAMGEGGGHVPMVVAGLGEKKSNNGTQWYQQDRIYDTDGVSPTLNTVTGGNLTPSVMVKNATRDGGIPVTDGGVMNLTAPGSHTRRGRVIDGGEITPTLDTGCNVGKVETGKGVLFENGQEVRVRKLTPKECFRLQGFPEEYYERAAQVCSDSQLYKQAGNAVTVNVVYQISKRLTL